jgi:repressor LexA
MNIGQRIKLRRKKLGISADELACKLKLSRSTIFRYEKGDIEKLPVDILEPISKILNVSPSYLMGWDDIKDSQKTELKIEEKKIIDNFRLLNEKGQKKTLDYIQDLLIGDIYKKNTKNNEKLKKTKKYLDYNFG